MESINCLKPKVKAQLYKPKRQSTQRENMARTFANEELKDIINMLFEHFKKPWILEREFNTYLKTKGYTDEEISEIWFQALSKGLVEIKGVLSDNMYELAIYKPTGKWGCTACR